MTKRDSGLTAEEKAELDALEALPDDQIDTSDIPETLDWSGARRGVFYRGVKRQAPRRDGVKHPKPPTPDT